MKRILDREPALFFGLIAAAIGVVMAFGWFDFTAKQQGAIFALAAAVLAFATRQSVYPPASVDQQHGPITVNVTGDAAQAAAALDQAAKTARRAKSV